MVREAEGSRLHKSLYSLETHCGSRAMAPCIGSQSTVYPFPPQRRQGECSKNTEFAQVLKAALRVRGPISSPFLHHEATEA